jgi:hypothetical protein
VEPIILKLEQMEHVISALGNLCKEEPYLRQLVDCLAKPLLGRSNQSPQDDDVLVNSCLQLLTQRFGGDEGVLQSIRNLEYTYQQKAGLSERLKHAETPYDRIVSRKRQNEIKALCDVLRVTMDEGLKSVIQDRLRRIGAECP